MRNYITAFLIFVITALFVALWLTNKKPKEAPQQTIDSLAWYRHQLDVILIEIDKKERADSISSVRIDSLIKKKYDAKKIFINNSDTFHSLLRIELLTKLDSTRFEY
jgi:hypothetical protein